MLSLTVTCCTNIQILIRSRVEIEFLHLLWKFHGYFFNGLEDKRISKLPRVQSKFLGGGKGWWMGRGVAVKGA